MVPRSRGRAPSAVAAGRFRGGMALRQQHATTSGSVTTAASSQTAPTTPKPSTEGCHPASSGGRQSCCSAMDLFCTGFAHLQKCFFFSGLHCLHSSLLLPGCFLYSEQQFAHLFGCRTALSAQHQLRREGSRGPEQEPQITLPPRGTWKREGKDTA